MSWLGIALMASCGALVRFYLAQRWNTESFYWGTFSVNIVGSLLIGVAFVLYQEWWQGKEGLYLALSVGFLGALTTFSSFSLEILNLFHQQGPRAALVYMGLTNASSILCCFLGAKSTQYVLTRVV